MKNYVQEREAILKQEYATNMWWIRICNFWTSLAEAMTVKRELDYHQDCFNKIRAKYIKRGRKAAA